MVTAAILGMAGLAVPGTAQTLSLDPGLWMTDGRIFATAISGRTLYVGGDFGLVAPYTGCGVPVGAGGAPVKGFPMVSGSGPYVGVFAAVPDGAGGWYIGGSFDSVGGVERRNLAHILGDNTISGWNPGTDGLVWTLALSDGVLYAGGKFTSVEGQARNRIAALDPETGSVSAWNPDANSEVWMLFVSGASVYAGGLFAQIGGAARGYIAALDATTGAATAWDAGANDWVSGLVVDGNTVYAGGMFTTIGGQARNHIAALDATTGLATPWDPNANERIFTLAVDKNTVYAGGWFTWDRRLHQAPPTIGGETRDWIAALDKVTGHATPWSPTISGPVNVLSVSGETVNAGGVSQAAGFDKVTGQATWSIGGFLGSPYVWTVSPAVGVVYVGGRFIGLGGQYRTRLAAIDMDTGQATAWNPGATASVRALSVSGKTVYVGGDFRYAPGFPDPSIGGQQRNFVAALDAVTGLATPWNPDVNNIVTALVADRGIVYAGGIFTTSGGQVRNRIAALDSVTALPTAWDPNASGSIAALAVSGSVIYAAGTFTTIGGQVRNRIAALDAGTGLATAWDPNANGSVRALALGGSVVYAGGLFTSIGGQTRNFIAALSVADGLATSWNPDALANTTVGVRALAAQRPAPGADPDVVFVGGAFGTIGGKARRNLAAIDATTGLATEWQADVDTTVWSISADGHSVYAGGDFATLGGETRLHLVGFRSDTPTATLLTTFTAVWRAGTIELAWNFADAAAMRFERLERAPAPAGPWTACAAEIRDEGERTVATDRDVEEGVTYWYRLVAIRADGSPNVLGPIAATASRTIREFTLSFPAPNPTAGAVRIEFELSRQSRVRLLVHDLEGRELARLVDGEQDAGPHLLLWDGKGRTGPLLAGLYFLRLETPAGTLTRRVVVTP